MKKIFPLIVITFFAFSCNKEDDPIINPYFNEGYITYQVNGTYKGYDLNESGTYSLFKDYTDSYTYQNNNDVNIIQIARLSDNLTSEISFNIGLDSTKSYIKNDQPVMFNMFLEKEDNIIINLASGWYYIFDMTDTVPNSDDKTYFKFNNIQFSPEKNTISGDYYFNTSSVDGEGDFTIQGSFKAQLYNYAN